MMYPHQRLILLSVAVFCVAIIQPVVVSTNLRVSTCDRNKRKKTVDCPSYTSCAECNACDSYCSWCNIGGLCTRFCEGLDQSWENSAEDCHSDDCPKKAEYKCMLMAMPEGSRHDIDYQKEGGIDLEAKEQMSPAIGPDNRGIDKAPNEPRTVRPFSPFAIYRKNPAPDGVIVPPPRRL